MKHFLTIAYIVFCVLQLNAQTEPVEFYIDNGALWKNDFIKEKKTKITDVPGIVYSSRTYLYDNCAFDIFNGRFFILSLVVKEANPFNDPSLIHRIYVKEIDVKSGKIKNHLLSGKKYYYDIHYDPINNRLLLNCLDTLKSLDLSNGTVQNIGIIDPALFPEGKTSFYFPESQQYLYGVKVLSIDTFYRYYLSDLNTGKNKLFFTSKILLNNFVYSQSRGLFGFSDFPVKLFSISQKGELKLAINLPDSMHTHADETPAFSNRNILLVRLGTPGHSIFKINLEKKKFESSLSEQRGFYNKEFHTYSKPMLLQNGDTLFTTYGKSYRWLWNYKPIQHNADEQKHVPRQCGYYAVEVTHLDGRIDTSEAVYNHIYDRNGRGIQETFTTVYPNPFQNNLTVKYTTCTEANTYIKIYDATGRLVLSYLQENLVAGEHLYNWDTQQNLRAGLYFIKIYSRNELISTHKVLKQ